MSPVETEADTRANRIDPVLAAAGWGVVPGSRIRREVICPGRLQSGGARGKGLACDYVLIYRSKKLAVIEAKRADLGPTEGMSQAKDYAERLQTRYAFSTNGHRIYRADMTTGAEGYETVYPSPDDLWAASFAEDNIWRDRFADVPFEDKGGQWQPRYYQHNAIEAALEGIAAGEKRLLLTLATGTGKTAIAFQIAWKLFHSRWTLSGEGTRRPRILFLADRNNLADQAFNAFSAFAEDARVRIDPDAIRKNGRVPMNGSVFFTIFQTFMSGRAPDGAPQPNFGDYPADFFDLIVIDECHRGGARDEGQWRAILEYFAPAVQLGLTATPKREANADTYRYFGEPIYVYSLKDGINDGYLTPFKVRQHATTMDDYTYVGEDQVQSGAVEIGEHFEEGDFNRSIVIEERERFRVRTFLGEINQRDKTLVFCATQAHAAMVRDLINQEKASKDPLYCVRVTSDDGEIGNQHLRTFQDNEKTIPTILTTSQKLSTGVDARNVRNIVLMRPVNSMIEFKQIIGRGTRLYEGKDYFTIHDFVNAHERFHDKDWDGEPIEPEPATPRPPKLPPEPTPPADPTDDDADDTPRRPVVRITLADGSVRKLRGIAVTSFWSPDGIPMSAKDFIERMFGELPELFKDEDELRALWGHPETRRRLLEALGERGYGAEQLEAIWRLIDAPASDVFDVLAYIAFARDPITREARVGGKRGDILATYDDKLAEFIGFVLGEYVRDGYDQLDDSKLADLLTLKFGGLQPARSAIGDMATIRKAFIGFQSQLYAG